jgi:hypothetical protein
MRLIASAATSIEPFTRWSISSMISTFAWVDVGPQRDAGTLQGTGETSAAFLDDTLLVLDELVSNELRHEKVEDVLAAQGFDCREQWLVSIIARQV